MSLDLNLLLAQMPHLTQIVAAESDHPEAQRARAAMKNAEHLKKSGSKVQKAEESDKVAAVREDRREEEREHHHMHKRKEKKDEPEDGGPSHSSPWAGNIIDVKI